MPRRANDQGAASRAQTPRRRSLRSAGGSGRRAKTTAISTANRNHDVRETTAIVLRIAASRAAEFEAMFAAEEIPVWDDFTRRGRFQEASLVRVSGGSETRDGLQDYILHVVAADHEAHEEHDRDPRFNAFLAKAQKMQPAEPLVWFGTTIFQRRA